MLARTGKLILLAAVVVSTTAAGAFATARRFAVPEPHSYASATIAPIPKRAGQALSLDHAVDELARRGFTGIGRRQAKGRLAIVDATAPRGEKLTLVIDLRDGHITGARLRRH